MQPQTQASTTAATHDNPSVAVDYHAKPRASLTGDMVTRRSSPAEAPALLPSDGGTSAEREGRLSVLARTILTRLRARGSERVPERVAAGGAVFVFAYFFFLVAIFTGLNFMPGSLF